MLLRRVEYPYISAERNGIYLGNRTESVASYFRIFGTSCHLKRTKSFIVFEFILVYQKYDNDFLLFSILFYLFLVLLLGNKNNIHANNKPWPTFQ